MRLFRWRVQRSPITDSTQTKDIAASIKAAQDAAADAAALAATPAAIDISDSVSLSWVAGSTAQNLDENKTRFKKFKYVPALKAIFFEFQYMYSGTATAGQYTDFNVYCNYKKTAADSISTELNCSYDKMRAVYMQDDVIRITFKEDVSTGESSILPPSAAGTLLHKFNKE